MQDQKCFTYDESKQADVGPQNGFNFVLNLQDMPHDKPLSVNLYVHESGSYPDIFNVKHFSTEIFDDQITKIGVSITSKKTTRSFDSLSFEKRQCLLSNSIKDKTYKKVLNTYVLR